MHRATQAQHSLQLIQGLRSRLGALTSALLRPFSRHVSGVANRVLPLATSLVVLALASEAGGVARPRLPASPSPPEGALPTLRFVPDWRDCLHVAGPRRLPVWLSEPGPALVRRLQLRWVYRRLVELPEIDRVGRFAHVNLLLAGLSGGPELHRLALEPPRENYSSFRELTPGWSWWYVNRESWGAGVATGTRFLISDHAGTIVDPLTSELRWAIFLP